MLVLHHLNLLSRERDIPLYLGYWLYTIGNYKKYIYIIYKVAFPGISRENLPEITAKIYPSFPRKWEHARGPLYALKCLFVAVVVVVLF